MRSRWGRPGDELPKRIQNEEEPATTERERASDIEPCRESERLSEGRPARRRPRHIRVSWALSRAVRIRTSRAVVAATDGESKPGGLNRGDAHFVGLLDREVGKRRISRRARQNRKIWWHGSSRCQRLPV